MGKLLRGLAAATAVACLSIGPAAADSASFVLTPSWQKIASAGQSVDVQNNNPIGFAVLSTSASGAPGAAIGQALQPGEHRLYTLGSDLYAQGNVTIVVTAGFGGNGGGSSGPGPMTETQTVLTLAAGTSAQLVGTNAARKSLRWMVTGSNPMTVVPGSNAAVAGTGMNYSGSAGGGQQGGSESFEGAAVPTNAFQAVSTAGTTVTIWEGQ